MPLKMLLRNPVRLGRAPVVLFPKCVAKNEYWILKSAFSACVQLIIHFSPYFISAVNYIFCCPSVKPFHNANMIQTCGQLVKVAQSCLTLCDPVGYTVHGILQAGILEWIAFPFSRGSSQPRDWTQVSHITGRFFTSWATREALKDPFKNVLLDF